MSFWDRVADPEDRHPFFDQAEKIIKNRTGLAGLIIIALFGMAAVAAPLISPHDPVENALYDQLKPPVWEEGGLSRISSERMTLGGTCSRA